MNPKDPVVPTSGDHPGPCRISRRIRTQSSVVQRHSDSWRTICSTTHGCGPVPDFDRLPRCTTYNCGMNGNTGPHPDSRSDLTHQPNESPRRLAPFVNAIKGWACHRQAHGITRRASSSNESPDLFRYSQVPRLPRRIAQHVGDDRRRNRAGQQETLTPATSFGAQQSQLF
jgi:hypothetical protein